MANEVTVDPRYMTYDKDEVQGLLDKVNNADTEPTAESENMISSGAVAKALGNYATTESVTESLADKQDAMDEASEEDIRDIVKNWTPDAEPESEEA